MKILYNLSNLFLKGDLHKAPSLFIYSVQFGSFFSMCKSMSGVMLVVYLFVFLYFATDCFFSDLNFNIFFFFGIFLLMVHLIWLIGVYFFETNF